MSIQVLDRPLTYLTGSVERAILETLAYSDIFNYPLRADEIVRYMPVAATLEQVRRSLDDAGPVVQCLRGYYFLEGREAIVRVRERREPASLKQLRVAYRIGRLLGRLPFIRMAALTGSLAVLNSDATADLDYMLVAAPDRVWTARGLAVLMGRLTSHLGYTLCPNLIVSERRLEWADRSLYSAREICQMIPITGLPTYVKLRGANTWTQRYLPNAGSMPPVPLPGANPSRRLQSLGEWTLSGQFGDRLEAWERNRKMARLMCQPGYGPETNFDAEICQGNFDHHRSITQQEYRRRLSWLGINAPEE
ncbi:MAG TPA: hypothetical protein VMJ64_03975 [Anaerolineales bacterium]|nr:hypothetical protein [Anaerolineales bacterium]